MPKLWLEFPEQIILDRRLLFIEFDVWNQDTIRIRSDWRMNTRSNLIYINDVYVGICDI